MSESVCDYIRMCRPNVWNCLSEYLQYDFRLLFIFLVAHELNIFIQTILANKTIKVLPMYR